jgi:hypothetical protein
MRRFAAPIVLAAMIGCSLLVRVWINGRVEAPQVLCDEFIYGAIAKSFATTGHLRLRGAAVSGANLLYPVLIAPAWLAHRMSTVYGLAKAINAVLISLTAIPVYVWARRVVSRWWALLAAGLVLLLPGLVLSGMLMSENASLPAFTLALVAIGLVVERPTLWRQALVVVTLPLAFEARTENIVLLAVLPTALLLRLAFDARAGIPRRELFRGLRAYLPLALAFAAAAAAYLVHSGFSTARIFGTYEAVGQTRYGLGSVALWSLRHAGEAVLAVGVVPVCALVLWFLLGLTRGLPGPEERALVATAAAAMLWVLVVAGAFASGFSHWLIERYTFYAFPPLLIAFVLWLARGLPRPRIETSVAAVVPVALVPLVVLGAFLQPTGAFNTLTLHLFTRIPGQVPGGLTGARVIILALAAAVALAFVLAPAWFAQPVLPVAVAVLFGVASHAAHGNIVANSRAWPNATGPVRSWIDNAVGTRANRVAYVYVANPSVSASSSVLESTEFWNRSIGDVYTLGTPQLCPLPARDLRVNDASGQLLELGTTKPVHERYLVTDRGLALAGKLVASGGSPVQPLAVYRPARTLRLATRIAGVYADGWTASDATFFQYWSPSPRAGSIVVTMSRAGWIGPDVPGKVTIAVRRLGTRSRFHPTVVQRWTAHAGRTIAFRLPTPRPPFEVEVHVHPTFSPAQFGQQDLRQLGVQIIFAYLPPAAKRS